MMKHKKLLSLLLGVSLAAACLTGCSGGTNASDSDNTAESAGSSGDDSAAQAENNNKPADDEIIELTFIRAGTSEETQLAYEKLIAAYEEEHSNIKIEYQQVNFGDELETKLNTLYASNSAPDIVRAPISTIAQRASLGQYAELDDYIDGWDEKDTILDSAYDVATYQGHRYGIAVNIEASFLYYRKDHFEEAGLDPDSPPANWDELLEYAEALTIRDGDTVTRAGLGIPTSQGHQTLIPFARQNGATLVDEENNVPTFNDDATAEALDYLAQYSERNLLIPFIANTDQNPFEIGNASMMFGPLGTYTTLEANGADWLDQLGYAAMPSGLSESTFGGCQILFLSEEGEHKDEAWEFMQYLFTHEAIWEMIETAGASPVKTTVSDDFAAQFGERGEAYLTVLEYAQGMPKVEWSALFEKHIAAAYEEAMYLQKDGATALSDAMDDLKTELAD